MKTAIYEINLYYADSIICGFNPVTFGRFNYQKIWPDILQEKLGVEYRIVTEALSGKTTCWNLPYGTSNDLRISCTAGRS